MKFSNFLFPESREPALDERIIDETIAEAKLTEQLGFDAVWLAEHHFDGICAYVDPISFAAALTAVTKRIKIGFAVAQVSLHHPIRLAEQISLLDNITKPGVEIQQAMTRVRAQVSDETNKAQLPWDHTSLTGNVYLNPAPAPSDKAAAAPAAAPSPIVVASAPGGDNIEIEFEAGAEPFIPLKNEVLWKVLCHNICCVIHSHCELGIEPV